MKDIIKLGLILLFVCAVAGAALSIVNNITKPKIEEQKRLATILALTTALPEAAQGVIEPVIKADTLRYYAGYRDSLKKELVGYAFIAKQMGYSSEIETMVGVDKVGNIVGIKILHQLETPGLGTKIEEADFQAKFLNKTTEQLAVKKDGGEIESITGATISSRAVTNSVKSGIQKLEREVGGFKK